MLLSADRRTIMLADFGLAAITSTSPLLKAKDVVVAEPADALPPVCDASRRRRFVVSFFGLAS